MTNLVHSAIRNPKSAIAVLVSALAILVATLFRAGSSLPRGWSFALASGETALAELIQNLLLFIPLGAALALAGVRPRVAIALGAALSCSVEFAQQWIPGRDPSTGDIICNTISTALGVLLVRTAPRWLFTTPARSSLQAIGIAILAAVVWLATAALLRLDVNEPPYHVAARPELHNFGAYRGRVQIDPNVRLPYPNPRDGRIEGAWAFRVTATAPPAPPGRTSPLLAILDNRRNAIVMLSIDGHDLTLRHHMPAVELTLVQPDLRWRGALEGIAPGDSFVTAGLHDRRNNCIGLNSGLRCFSGFTVGDGWKLIFYPERFPAWLLGLLNALWIAGWTVGVGYWARRAGTGGNRRGKAGAIVAIVVVLVGLAIVPVLTGLKRTPVTEWIGAVLGILVGASPKASQQS